MSAKGESHIVFLVQYLKFLKYLVLLKVMTLVNALDLNVDPRMDLPPYKLFYNSMRHVVV